MTGYVIYCVAMLILRQSVYEALGGKFGCRNENNYFSLIFCLDEELHSMSTFNNIIIEHFHQHLHVSFTYSLLCVPVSLFIVTVNWC